MISLPPFRLNRCAAQGAFLIALALAFGATAAEEPAKQPTEKQIKNWVAELGANEFLVRKAATEALVDAGAPAIDPLVAALGDASFEVVSRGVHILREFALSGEEPLEKAAEAALEKLTDANNPPLVSRANATLETLVEVREDRAITVLMSAGAQPINDFVNQNGRFQQAVVGLEFDSNWKGKPADLEQLSRLKTLQRLTFSGPKFDDRALELAGGIDSLAMVTIKRAKVTSAGMASLSRAQNLNMIAVLYVPIDDKAVDSLANANRLVSLRLYGTKISNEGAEKLAAKLPAAEIDFRRGAFLGVGGHAVPGGCAVSQVHGGSAASKAGVLVGDIIVSYNEKPVPDFDTLKELISEHDAGKTVEIELKRGGQVVKRELTLGEWEQ